MSAEQLTTLAELRFLQKAEVNPATKQALSHAITLLESTGMSEDDEPYGVKICRNVIFYACFSRHTDNLKAGEMKAAIAVLFPPDVVGLASKPPTSPQQP